MVLKGGIMTTFEIFMKFVKVFEAVAEHYNKIHFFIYKYIMRGDLALEDFYITHENVGLWYLTMLSVVICFSLIFIPINSVESQLRKERIWIRRIVPFGVIFAPFPMLIYFAIASLWVIEETVKYTFMAIDYWSSTIFRKFGNLFKG